MAPTINDRRAVNGQIATLIHELAHALVRHDRQPDDPALSYAQEELVIESVADTVCGACGLDVAGAAVPYLASWAEVVELETIEQTAKLIDRLARRIETAVLEELEVVDPAAAPHSLR
jgi:antirestriction protein ArdC